MINLIELLTKDKEKRELKDRKISEKLTKKQTKKLPKYIKRAIKQTLGRKYLKFLRVEGEQYFLGFSEIYATNEYDVWGDLCYLWIRVSEGDKYPPLEICRYFDSEEKNKYPNWKICHTLEQFLEIYNALHSTGSKS